MMTWLAPLGIIVSIILIMYLAMKGFSILVIGPLAALLVVLTNGMDIFGALLTGKTSFMTGLAGFVGNFFAVFLLGSILAKYIEESGAAKSIANAVLKVTGTDKPFSVLIAILLICSFLTYGGVSLFVVLFAVLPLSKPIFKQLNLNWALVTIPVEMGIGTYTMTMLPGSPAIQNVIPTQTLGTTLTAAPLLGIVATLVTLVVGLWYMKRELDKSLRNGEVYDESDKDTLVAADDMKLPSVGLSTAPLLILIAIIIVGSIMKIPNIIITGLVISILIAAVLLGGYTKNGHKTVINTGALGSITPVFFTAAPVGFGAVIAAAPGFKIISNAIFSIPGSPLISGVIATNLMSLVTGSASGSEGIILPIFGKTLLDVGLNPEVIHRVIAVASGPLSAVPQSGAVLSFLALTGLTHKKCYKHFVGAMMVPSLIALVVILAMAIVMY